MASKEKKLYQWSILPFDFDRFVLMVVIDLTWRTAMTSCGYHLTIRSAGKENSNTWDSMQLRTLFGKTLCVVSKLNYLTFTLHCYRPHPKDGEGTTIMFTARVRSTTGGYVFSLSTQGGGYPISAKVSNPPPPK